MASFVNVSSVFVKVEAIVECDAKVLKAANDLNRLRVNGNGALG